MKKEKLHFAFFIFLLIQNYFYPQQYSDAFELWAKGTIQELEDVKTRLISLEVKPIYFLNASPNFLDPPSIENIKKRLLVLSTDNKKGLLKKRNVSLNSEAFKFFPHSTNHLYFDNLKPREPFEELERAVQEDLEKSVVCSYFIAVCILMNKLDINCISCVEPIVALELFVYVNLMLTFIENRNKVDFNAYCTKSIVTLVDFLRLNYININIYNYTLKELNFLTVKSKTFFKHFLEPALATTMQEFPNAKIRVFEYGLFYKMIYKSYDAKKYVFDDEDLSAKKSSCLKFCNPFAYSKLK